ncbi:penicillin-binding protein 2 [Candidatus Methylacidiphilum fumarolicum]|uniref:Cell division protein FtsI n=2 Tax=Candidatus Methylacidiphilum fumarolicum TaxID=591154 RepID=I0JW33_METFB|nr:penicillin-binding protein 2 [Candidatus Methylacidiphilum fumarolicum]MBW6415640.1 penicillin-binding protein 2 [Candidatus Methylacidiphilum fumarolicum]TFE66778.1 cell division protein FtsI [Candidatus Methylacidiphilum fumarolicum]TFE71704.1 penicillin-binding protein 2 [Candidatus Methylacidiphilum fumarolicum]TFE73633.1 penicillin-binding protein 2 [Candidatus Methylacidiphilum fumarolicum]TFE77643.1 cell division protein FtsI [Candidatus Methylacidiphilum fumarolicum]
MNSLLFQPVEPKKNNLPKDGARSRALIVFAFLSLGFTVISLRLLQIQLFEHEKYLELATTVHTVRKVLPPKRGYIVDCKNVPLAQSFLTYKVRLDGMNVQEPAITIQELEEFLGLEKNSLLQNFRRMDRSYLLAKGLSEEKVQTLEAFEKEKLRQWKKKKLPAEHFLTFEEDYSRIYPCGREAAPLIGYLDENGKGAAGVEKAMNEWLEGTPGEKWIERDVFGKEIAAYRGLEVKPVDGCNVSLTLDSVIQHIVEEGIDRVEKEFLPNGIMAIVMNPKTGEILAMAQRPSFDPNRREKWNIAFLKNKNLTDPVEPGSIFKIVTLSGILEEKIFSLDNSTINCENGAFFYGGKTLHDSHPYGMLSVREVVMKSSNIGFAKMGLELGENRLYHYARAFGFGEPTGMLLGQGESPGILYPPRLWSKLSITRIPMGQEIAVTPIQMIRAMAAIANHGYLVKPMIIKDIRNPQGKIIRSFSPVIIRRVISERTAKLVTSALVSVVSPKGTGAKAAIMGFTVAGKTGTAQKVVHGNYVKGKYISSFIGFLPAEDPEFVLMIMVDEPHGTQYYAASVAAPAFSYIGSEIAQALNLTPKCVPAQAIRIETEK